MSRPRPGDTIDGKYRVERVLGEGGMGFVLQATHVLREAPVALKFLLPDVASVPEVVERFVNEAVAASKLECEHVIRVHDVGQREGLPYLVLEYLEGQDLDDVIKEGSLDVARAVHVMLQVLRALSAAHGKGIVHRDLKPANVFLTRREGEPDFVKLLDFGVSKLERPDAKRLTATASGLGTPLYMSPEQARSAKNVDERTDIYAAGVMLYQMLAGRPPFDGETLTELLSKVLLDAEERIEALRPDLPDGLADVVHRALEKSPGDRFPDADSFARALVPFSDDRSAVLVARLRAANARSMRETAPSAAELPKPPAPKREPDTRTVRASTSPVAETVDSFAADQQPAAVSKRAPAVWWAAGAAAAPVLIGVAALAWRSSQEPDVVEPVAAASSVTVALRASAPTVDAPEPVSTASALPASASAPPAQQPPTAPPTTGSAAPSRPPPSATRTSKPPERPPSGTSKPPSNPLDIQLK